MASSCAEARRLVDCHLNSREMLKCTLPCSERVCVCVCAWGNPNVTRCAAVNSMRGRYIVTSQSCAQRTFSFAALRVEYYSRARTDSTLYCRGEETVALS